MRNVLLWMLTLVVISAASVNAQVIIGGDGTQYPHAGAGLDLSLLGADKLGLLLPSVELTDDAEEFALVADATDEQKTDATGMLVYNADDDILAGAGLYVWDGAKWQAVAVTPATVTPVDDYPSVTDAEGNKYAIGYFGEAGWWTTENLRSTYYIDANSKVRTKIFIKNDDADTDSPWYHYPDGVYTSEGAPESYQQEYGLLYTWAAASGRTNTDNNDEGGFPHQNYQGVCPDGWHLPSDSEWTQLTDVISASADGAYSTTMEAGNIGTKMKSQTLVNSTENDGTSQAANENGFDALLVGVMYTGSAFGYGWAAAFWSSSSYGSEAWRRAVGFGETEVFVQTDGKYHMFSVRCKKNE
jgi:uncharacterized protein (TIGR02145 family)